VDVALTDDQELFRETTARFIEAHSSMAEVRRFADGESEDHPVLARDAGALGWFALFVPEEFGGGSVSGSPVRDAVIVAEERGRLVGTSPFVATNVVADAIARDGSPAQCAAYLPSLATGDLIASWAISDGLGLPTPDALRVSARDGGHVLDGTAGFVPDGSTAGLLLASASDAHGNPAQFLVPTDTAGVTIEALDGLDITRRFAEVHFDQVAVGADTALEPSSSASTSIDRQIDLACTLTLAESMGTMRRLLEMTVDYAKARTAFGRPIGSFQAVKHLLADASLRVEVSSAAAWAAADAVADGRPAASEIVSIAKAYVGDAATDVAQTCLQTHGGIGFTWEHDLHFHLRRLAADRALYGDPEWHRERICRIHEL
jgi:alkylation response protein AidB-like acyl-CoA dehydrogenase